MACTIKNVLERKSHLPGESGATELRRDMDSMAVSDPERMAVSMIEAALKECMPFSLCSVMLPPRGSDPALRTAPAHFSPSKQSLLEFSPCGLSNRPGKLTVAGTY